MFDTLKASVRLNIQLPARKIIIYHCVACPEMYGKAMATKITKKGLIVNGMIDENLHT